MKEWICMYQYENVEIFIWNVECFLTVGALKVNQDIQEVPWLVGATVQLLFQTLFHEPGRDSQRLPHVPVHLPPQSLRIQPTQPRKQVGHVSVPRPLHQPHHRAEKLRPVFGFRVKQVPWQHQVPEQVKRHQENKTRHVDPTTMFWLARFFRHPVDHVVYAFPTDGCGVVYAFWNEHVHGHEAPHEAPVRAIRGEGQGWLVVVVDTHDFGYGSVREGVVVVLEEHGGGFGGENRHGVHGADFEPHHGAELVP